MAKKVILTIVDEEHILDLLEYNLEKGGYDVLRAETGEKGLAIMKTMQVDLVLLDYMLPGMDGIEVLKTMRADPALVAMPVIMLTAKGEEIDKVLGLDGGADDYVAKPFGMMELLSRIRALLRRTRSREDVLEAGCLRVVPAKHTVQVDDREIVLTQKEFEMLCLLLRHRGEVLSREQLIEQIWGYTFTGETRTVDVHVRTLRQKLGKAGQYIETVRGYGYKMAEQAGERL